MIDWYQSAAVRRWSWPETSADQQGGYNYFSPNLVTAAQHPRVRAGGPAVTTCLQRRHLFRYLAVTEAIEIELVNPALCHVMKQPELRDFVPQAYRIYTDEGFHAVMCLELRERLVGSAEVPYVTRYRSAGLMRIFALCGSYPERMRDLALFTAASLNETLITPSLRQSTDPTVAPLVRRVIEAHAADEAVHHAFFARLFCTVWAGLPSADQQLLAELIPQLGTALLQMDWDAVGQDLVEEGFDSADVALIIDEMVSATDRQPAHADSVAGMVRMLQRSGAGQFESVRRYIIDLLNSPKRLVV
jgi:hypothetical protein